MYLQMKKIFFFVPLFLFLVIIFDSIAQQKNQELLISEQVAAALNENYLNTKVFFEDAYNLYPKVPKGILEAVSYHYTHFRHITNESPESCAGLPRVYGIMGLTLDGKNYFRNNLITVSALSGFSQEDIINYPSVNVKAFASAFVSLKNQMNIISDKPEDMLKILSSLSELNIRTNTVVNDYVMNLYLFGILSFLNNPENQSAYNLPAYNIDLKSVFGEANLKVFKSKKVNIINGGVTEDNGQIYSPTDINTTCPDYNFPNCSWVASPNFNSRNGVTISAVAMHTVQGSYTGCISYFQNTSANASTQYIVASNSSYGGQVTQMVLESDRAWHVGTENSYAIGYEHEGFVDDPSWYTVTMYQTSANLTKNICQDHNISTLRTFFTDTLDNGTAMDHGVHSLGGESSCVKIKGHQHFTNQTHTDPAEYWYWDYYYKLLNLGTPVTTLTSPTGNFYDSGGAASNYSNDQRKFWLFQPNNATQITLSFSSFAVEANYDFLYIYDGTNEFAPLIGRYNTQSPGTITSTGGSLFVEFRSDCATNLAGWQASWTSVIPYASAGFLISDTSICEGESIQFTNTSINAISYNWTLNGGTPTVSSLTNPLVVFDTTGVFNIQLDAYGIIDTSTVIQQVIVSSLPRASFLASDTMVFLPNALVLFTNMEILLLMLILGIFILLKEIILLCF